MSFKALPEVATYGTSVGSGQCVAYVQAVAGAPLTAHWRRGQIVKESPITPGTAIATFDDDGKYGNHTDGRSHAAIYLGQDAIGLHVLDAWVGQPVHFRVIAFGRPLPVNDGNKFYVIESDS